MKRALLLVCLSMCCSLLQADEPAAGTAQSAAASDRYETRRIHDPNGIGKFYMGREIAHVMGFAGAAWLERSTREEEERLTLRALRLKPGDVVADIGAGSGVISMLMAEPILPGGRVLAVDVQQEMLDRLKAYCEQLGVENVEPIRGSQKRSGLKPASVDMAIMVDVYHEFEYPYEMLADISKALKPGGRLVFEQPEFGLSWLETVHVLPLQHVIIFRKQATAESGPASERGQD